MGLNVGRMRTSGRGTTAHLVAAAAALVLVGPLAGQASRPAMITATWVP